MFWDEDFCNNQRNENENGETSRKRYKRSNKIQSFLDLIIQNNSQMNWRWLVILSETINSYPHVVENKADILNLLELIADFQVQVQYPLQIASIIKCCRILIESEINLPKQDQLDLQDMWDKITTSCYR